MNKRVEAYLEEKRQEELAIEAQYREDLLIQEGLCVRAYPVREEYNYDEYPYWDEERGRHYKLKPLDVTDEEFKEIEKYANIANTAKTTRDVNVGKKIMNLATVACWMGIIAAIVGGIIIMTISEAFIFLGFLTAVGGALTVWISSWFMYALGQLVDDTHELRKMKEKEMEERL